jgi:hypothetical protein
VTHDNSRSLFDLDCVELALSWESSLGSTLSTYLRNCTSDPQLLYGHLIAGICYCNLLVKSESNATLAKEVRSSLIEAANRLRTCLSSESMERRPEDIPTVFAGLHLGLSRKG